MRYQPHNTFLDKLFRPFDYLSQYIHDSLFAMNPREFIDLETVNDEYTLVMREGSLVSCVRIDGSSKTVLHDEVVTILDAMETKLTAYMTDGCHYFSFFFSADQDGVAAEIDDIYTNSALKTTHDIGLDWDDLIYEQRNVMLPYCQKERVYLLVWTNIHGLSKEEKQQIQRVKSKQRKGLPLQSNAQSAGMGVSAYVQKHHSLINSVVEDMRNVGLACDLVDSHSFIREMRNSIDSEFTGPDWSPSLPGDPIPFRFNEDPNPDLSGMGYPKLREQVFPRSAFRENHSVVEIGDTLFSPLTIEIPPKHPQPFQALFQSLSNEKIPWRMHMLVRKDGMSVFGFKETLASFLAFTPGTDDNDYIINAKKQLKKLRDKGEEIVKMQISFCTWAPKGEIKLVEKRRAILSRIVQGWGVCQPAQAEGDALETTLSSVPGATLGSTANPSAPPPYMKR